MAKPAHRLSFPLPPLPHPDPPSTRIIPTNIIAPHANAVGWDVQDEALNISRRNDITEAASFFLEKGVGLVVVTRGSQGAFAVSAGGEGVDEGVRVEGSGIDCEGATVVGMKRSMRRWVQRCSSVEV